MKSRETLIRLKKLQVDEKRRRVAQIEAMIAEFNRIAGELEREIKAEQDRAGIHDPAHFAYPTYAKAANSRRENLKHSTDELRVQLGDAKAALGEAFEELKKVEMLDERDQQRERTEEDVREEAKIDHSAGLRFNAGGAPAKTFRESLRPRDGAVRFVMIRLLRPDTAENCDQVADRLSIIGLTSQLRANNPAAIGFTVIVLATRAPSYAVAP